MSDEHGPSNRDKSKEHVKKLLERPEHKKPKGSPEDEATRDGALDDPREADPDE